MCAVGWLHVVCVYKLVWLLVGVSPGTNSWCAWCDCVNNCDKIDGATVCNACVVVCVDVNI